MRHSRLQPLSKQRLPTATDILFASRALVRRADRRGARASRSSSPRPRRSVVPPLLLPATHADAGAARRSRRRSRRWHGHRYASRRAAPAANPSSTTRHAARLGGFIGRLHAVGRRRPFEHRHRLERARRRPARVGAAARWRLRPGTQRRPGSSVRAGARPVERGLRRARTAGDAAPARRLPSRQRAVARRHRRTSSTSTTRCRARRCRTCGCWSRATTRTMARQLDRLLDGYEQFCEFDDRERALIEPLRTLRMVRHSAWLAERWSDPTFPLNFPFFGSAAYWSQQTTQLREQLEAMAGGWHGQPEPSRQQPVDALHVGRPGSSSWPPSASSAWSNRICARSSKRRVAVRAA